MLSTFVKLMKNLEFSESILYLFLEKKKKEGVFISVEVLIGIKTLSKK